MNALTAIKIVIGLLKIANWIAVQITQKQWKASGYQDAVNDNIKAINKHIKSIEDIRKDVKSKSDEGLDKELES